VDSLCLYVFENKFYAIFQKSGGKNYLCGEKFQISDVKFQHGFLHLKSGI
jgi:hypothetical protein